MNNFYASVIFSFYFQRKVFFRDEKKKNVEAFFRYMHSHAAYALRPEKNSYLFVTLI